MCRMSVTFPFAVQNSRHREMITLKVSFLLAVNLKEDPMKNSKKPLIKTNHQNKSEEASKMPQLPEEPTVYSVIKVQNPQCHVHVSYELLPKKFKYAVDIVCWGPIAKIVTKSGTKYIKTVAKGDVVWIPVFIEHYLNPLSNDEIRGMLKQMMVLNFNTRENSPGQKAKSQKPSVFYIFNEDASRLSFPEAFLEKPTDDRDAFVRKEIERILAKLGNFPVNREITTWIYNTDDVHSHKISEIIQKRLLKEKVSCRNLYEKDDLKTNEKNSSKNKKKKIKSLKTSKTISTKRSKLGSGKSNRKKSKKERSLMGRKSITVKIPINTFFSDPVIATYQVNEVSSKLDEAYILLGSSNILTPIQKQQLCPLVVKLRKINNLPNDILITNGFVKVFLKCIIPGITEFRTSLKAIDTTVKFDESFFIITDDFPKIKILEILEAKLVVVEVIGVRESNSISTETEKKKKTSKRKQKGQLSVKSSKSGETRKTSKSSGRKENISPMKEETLTLAAVTFDLSSLSQNFFLFREKGSCRSQLSLNTEEPLAFHEHFIDRLTLNELGSLQFPKENQSPLTDSLLFSRGTTVKFEAHFLFPTYPILYHAIASRSFRRLLVIFFNREIAESFLSSVLLHNSNFLGLGPLLFPNFLLQQHKDRDSVTEDKHDETLSGFAVDDGNCFIIYAEGPSNGHILNLLHQVDKISFPTGKVFYNSDYIFAERIYFKFYEFSGYFFITLKVPLSEMFAHAKTYIRGNMPIPCFNAIKKLNLILNSTTFKQILSEELLPAEVELLSLLLEYGLNLRYKAKSLIESSRTSAHNTQTSGVFEVR